MCAPGLGTLAPGGGGLGAAGAGPCGSARLFWGRRGVSRREAGQGRRTSGERLACVHWLPWRARCCAGSLGACTGWGQAGHGWRVGSMRSGKPLRGVTAWVPPLATELPYPDRRAPRRFLVVRAARTRCGARLGVPVARRGGFRAGAAPPGALRGRRTSGERLACMHWLPWRARCCAGSLGACTGWGQARHGWRVGSMRSGKPLRGATARVPHLV